MLRQLKTNARAQQARRPKRSFGLALAERYCTVRFETEKLVDPLSPEDLAIQSLPEARPAKWHLAHTSWFVERVLLKEANPAYKDFNGSYERLFNSHGEALGERHGHGTCRSSSRPTIEEVFDYRRHVDAQVLALLGTDERLDPKIANRIEAALQHEQQHQELLLTDIKHAFATNPMRPRYLEPPFDTELLASHRRCDELAFRYYPTTITALGNDGEGFAFDNEKPRHQVLVHERRLARRLVTCGEFAAFIADGGYCRPELWLADGWALVNREGLQAPLYWEWIDEQWWHMTLAGLRRLCEAEPVCHVSYYEAEAYARWARARLPTEYEWEIAAAELPLEGNFAESGVLHPVAIAENDDLVARGLPQQMFGDVWEWTASPHLPYPGFRPGSESPMDSSARYMCNQIVLRGGSCVTPRSHMRATYRNYLPPHARWQFSGFRLAR